MLKRFAAICSLTLVMALSFVMAPVATAEHPVTNAQETCEDAPHSVDHDVSQDEHDPDHHNHTRGHTHGCGTCHIHVYADHASKPVGVQLAIALNRLIPQTADLSDGTPIDLLRPPRV
ncbi:MAG: hypothetical protein CMK07_06315 [Ponticaulis sp.]|nr:hypothetical protein [Ponticaulis sp.]